MPPPHRMKLSPRAPAISALHAVLPWLARIPVVCHWFEPSRKRPASLPWSRRFSLGQSGRFNHSRDVESSGSRRVRPATRPRQCPGSYAGQFCLARNSTVCRLLKPPPHGHTARPTPVVAPGHSTPRPASTFALHSQPSRSAIPLDPPESRDTGYSNAEPLAKMDISNYPPPLSTAIRLLGPVAVARFLANTRQDFQ